MASEDLIVARKTLHMRRAVMSPSWPGEKVLTSDLWTYVSLWLRRNARATDAPFYWDQAREFYHASLDLPVTASPLTLYYCFLNATKALLAAKGIAFGAQHGLTGRSREAQASIANEEITLKSGGVLPSLMTYYREPLTGDTYSLKDMFYNLAFIHRAYCLSYTAPYLFFALHDCRYVRGVGSSEGWITANLEAVHDDARVLATLPPGFERDAGHQQTVVVRKRRRFRWRNGVINRGPNLGRLTAYHSALRRDVTYIAGVGRWYLKRRVANATIIDRHVPVIIFSCMHRISELSRYDPPRLSRLLDTQRNWLLAEFVKTAPIQFLDEIACELTGQEIEMPGIHAGSLLSGG